MKHYEHVVGNKGRIHLARETKIVKGTKAQGNITVTVTLCNRTIVPSKGRKLGRKCSSCLQYRIIEEKDAPCDA